jgi:hypothetical protein
MNTRAFDAYLDMAKSSIGNADGLTAELVSRNLPAFLKNAFDQVKPSAPAIECAADVESAWRQFLNELAKTPLGLGKSEGIDHARQLVIDRLERLRAELHRCQVSETAKILGLS